MFGEHFEQQTLILTRSKSANWKWLSKVIKKTNDEVFVDHTKSSKTPKFIEIIEIEENFSIENVFSTIQEFHDNGLQSRDDNRLFRVVIDDYRLLEHQFLINLMVLSRKTNISFMFILDLPNESYIDPFFIYFDKIIELGELSDNIKNTMGTVKIRKFKEMEAFSVSEGLGLGAQKVFFWGFEKYNNLNFREIDITDIL